MKTFKITTFIALSSMITQAIDASAPAPARQSMELQAIVNDNQNLRDKYTEILKKNEELINEKLRLNSLLTTKYQPTCCDTLSNKCNNIGNRTDDCLLQRISTPFAQATCQKNDLCGGCKEDGWCRGIPKLIAAVTCLLPCEIACCPFYAICNAECAKACLCLN